MSQLFCQEIKIPSLKVLNNLGHLIFVLHAFHLGKSWQFSRVWIVIQVSILSSNKIFAHSKFLLKELVLTYSRDCFQYYSLHFKIVKMVIFFSIAYTVYLFQVLAQVHICSTSFDPLRLSGMKFPMFSYLICASCIVFGSSKTWWIGLSFYFLPLWCSTSHFEELLEKVKDGTSYNYCRFYNWNL